VRQAQVYYKNEFAGIIQETDEGFLFLYDTEYLAKQNSKPISLTLPLQQKAFLSKVLFPFFDGLIPEGWLLNIAINNWKIKPSDRFGLLLTLCKDSIGCVSIISNEKES
jgi:serine/threonine-protein kinase HipA